MYILDEGKFDDFDIFKAEEFVNIWSKFYNENQIKAFDSGNTTINYFMELNIGNNLSEQNLKRLLRWRDPRYLTEEKMSGKDKGKKMRK